MRIAVCYNREDGTVFGHFGRTEFFRIYSVAGNTITGSEVISTAETGGHEALAPFLKEHDVDTLIAGGAGMGARNALAACGIKLIPGVTGSADAAVKAYIEGSLSYDPDASCNHHHHEGEGHCHHHHGGEGHCHHHEEGSI